MDHLNVQKMTASPVSRALAALCRQLGLDPGDAASSVAITGNDPVLPTRCHIGAAGAVSHVAVGLAAARLHRLRGGAPQAVSVGVPATVASLRANHYLTIDGGKPPRPWDSMSGFYRTQDSRWIFLHCNFPNLRDRAAALLGVAPEREAVQRACADWDGEALETAIHEAGGCAAFVRSMEEWRGHPHHAPSSALPVLEVVRIGDAPPEDLPEGDRPLAGVRMLDLTRVIAGPACSRILAEHGADVLKISRPDLPHSGLLDIDSGVGKLAAFLDFRDAAQAEHLRSLVRAGDVFLQSYRPGALASHGFGPADLAAMRPGIVVATLSAWGHEGPWRDRRGYDTIVQSATGLADLSGNDETPAVMPVSALDYIAGDLLALGIMTALARRATEGGSWLVRTSLVQAQHWLMGFGLLGADEMRGVPRDVPMEHVLPHMRETDSVQGRIRYLGPVLTMSATPPRADRPPVPLGTNAPEWPAR